MLFRRLFCPFVTVLSLLLATLASAAEFVGGEVCAACHQEQHADWMGSHHQLAMAEATSDTVLGDFGQVFELAGIRTEFEQTDDGYFVTTDNADGELQRFEVTHTFGWDPLQQYLVSFPDGRKQVLQIAWDTRPADQGGQRWFHLYPDNTPKAGDPLHWTGFTHNWNTSCASCHSTDLQKNYDPETNRFATRFTDINVNCESCHGPGSTHIAWAANPNDAIANMGLTVEFADTGSWVFQELGQAIATRVGAEGIPAEQEVCAQCHSLRTELLPFHGLVQENGTALGAFHDAFMLSPITEPQYQIDGQIQEEVFVAGSFFQSRMHDMGVTCSNCHNPHSLELVAPGNSLCAQCHAPAVYDTPAHHFHPVGSTGAECVECHMPETVFMQVDPRRDHSIRIPRPDLSAELGITNACSQCHTDETLDWSVQAFNQWWPDIEAHPAEWIQANREAEPGSINRLFSFLTEPDANALQKTLVLNQVAASGDANALNAIRRSMRADNPLERQSAVRAVANYPIDSVILNNLASLLNDPAISVRYQAIQTLASADRTGLSASQQQDWQRELQRTREILNNQLDVPGMALQLSQLESRLGNNDQANIAALQALTVAPNWTPALLNLAQLRADQGEEETAAAILEQTIETDTLSGDAHHALALSRVRSGGLAEAVDLLAKAAELSPQNAHYRYVYAVALVEIGEIETAFAQLNQAWETAPNSHYIGIALASYQIQFGDIAGARQTAAILNRRAPRNPEVMNILSYLSRLP